MLLIFKILFYGIVSRVLQVIVNLIYGPFRTQKSGNGVLCYDILWDWKPFDFSQPSPALFTLKFTGVRDLDWLIGRDDVTLYTVAESQFVFVRTRAGVDIHDASRFPFLYQSKHSAAVELFTVPRDVMLAYLGSELESRDGGNIVMLHNTGRCGSTLLTTMVCRTRQCLVLSEPWALYDMMNMVSRGSRDVSRGSVEFYQIVKAVFILLTPNKDTKYFIKPMSQVIFLIPLIKQVLPGIKEIFMHRAIRPTATSFIRAFGGKAPLKMMEDITQKQMPGALKDVWVQHRVLSLEHLTIFFIISNFYMYISETRDRTDVISYRYESLLEDRVKFCQAFFRDIGLADTFIDIALLAMEEDSQENSQMGKKNVSKSTYGSCVVSEEALEWGRKVGRELGVEVDGDTCHVVNLSNEWDT